MPIFSRPILVALLLCTRATTVRADELSRASYDYASEFEAASASVAAYADTAHTILTKGARGAPAFDLPRTRNALTKNGEHLILYAPTKSAQIASVSLLHLISIHFRISGIINSLPLMQSNGFDIGDVRAKLIATRAESRYLAEIFAQAARIGRADLAELAAATAMARPYAALASSQAKEKLAALAAEHKTRVARLKSEYGAQFPKLPGSPFDGMEPVPLPLVLSYREDPDHKILGDVWVPGAAAKRLI